MGGDRILCAAVHVDNGRTYPYQPVNIITGLVLYGHRHSGAMLIGNILAEVMGKGHKQTQGFLTSANRFVERDEAADIAYGCGQIEQQKAELYSEDLY